MSLTLDSLSVGRLDCYRIIAAYETGRIINATIDSIAYATIRGMVESGVLGKKKIAERRRVEAFYAIDRIVRPQIFSLFSETVKAEVHASLYSMSDSQLVSLSRSLMQTMDERPDWSKGDRIIAGSLGPYQEIVNTNCLQLDIQILNAHRSRFVTKKAIKEMMHRVSAECGIKL